MITFGQLLMAVSIPTIVSLVGILFNRSEVNALRTELTNFRLEMADKLATINVRLAIIETKMGIPPQQQKTDKEQTAA